jgi:hypothetical protein
VQFVHALEEDALRRGDVEDGLAGLRVLEEDDEVDRVAAAQRDADLAVGLEAADARAMAGARVDDDEGPHLRVGRGAASGRLDAHQRVVAAARQRPPVHQHLPVEDQHGRAAGLLMLDEGVPGAAHRVPEQDGALGRVDRVFHRFLHQRQRAAAEEGGQARQGGGLRRQRLGLAGGDLGQAAGLVHGARHRLGALGQDLAARRRRNGIHGDGLPEAMQMLQRNIPGPVAYHSVGRLPIFEAFPHRLNCRVLIVDRNFPRELCRTAGNPAGRGGEPACFAENGS